MKQLLFDFDGTLVNSMPYWSKAMLNVLIKTNTAYPADVIKIITPLGITGTAEYFRNDLGLDLSTEEIILRIFAELEPCYRNEIIFKDYVAEFLKSEKQKGTGLSILTASPHNFTDPCLKRLGYFDFFDNIWSTDDFGMTKTDVRIYSAAAQRLGTDIKDIAFFDDNFNALKTAGTAGLFTVGVYDKTSEEFIDEIKAVSDKYIYSFEELN